MKFIVELNSDGQGWQPRVTKNSLRQAKAYLTDLAGKRAEFRRTEGNPRLPNLTARIVNSDGHVVVPVYRLT